jgi:hypothetical protein
MLKEALKGYRPTDSLPRKSGFLITIYIATFVPVIF